MNRHLPGVPLGFTLNWIEADGVVPVLLASCSY